MIILDINMPVMDGVEAATLIKPAFPAVHIIVCTSYDANRAAGPRGLRPRRRGFARAPIRACFPGIRNLRIIPSG